MRSSCLWILLVAALFGSSQCAYKVRVELPGGRKCRLAVEDVSELRSAIADHIGPQPASRELRIRLKQLPEVPIQHPEQLEGYPLLEALLVHPGAGLQTQDRGGVAAPVLPRQDARALWKQARALFLQDQHASAEELATKLAAAASEHQADAYHLLALVKTAESETSSRKTSSFAESIQQAIRHAARAASLQPNSGKFRNTLGEALRRAGFIADAAKELAQAVQLEPRSPGAHSNYAVVLQALGQRELSYQQRVLAHKVAWHKESKHSTLIDLGIGAFGVQKTKEAISHFREALKMSPKFSAIVHKNLGLALSMTGDHAGAEHHYHQSVQLYPLSQPPPKVCVEALHLTSAVLLPFIMPSTELFTRLRQRFVPKLQALVAAGLHFQRPPNHVECQVSVPHFNLCYHGLNDRQINSEVATFFYRVCPSLKYKLPQPRHKQRASKQIRVGFMVSFEKHTVGRLFYGVISQLSSADIHVTVLTAHAEEGATLGDHVDELIELEFLSTPFDQLRARIAELQLDMLVFTEVGMEITAYFLALARLAPVQVSTWGHPVTSGSPQIDYFVSPAVEIPEAQAHYTEQLIRFEGLGIFMEAPKPISNSTRQELRQNFGFSDDSTIYVCPQNFHKLLPEFDLALGSILRACPLAQIVLIATRRGGELLSATLRQRLTHSIPDVANRVLILPTVAERYNLNFDFLSLLQASDVMLDPFPYGGGMTSLEGFAMSLPIVTLPARIVTGRLTLAMYNEMGFWELVAKDRLDYVGLAVKLGLDLQFRNSMVNKIAEHRSALYEDERSVRQWKEFISHAVGGTIDVWKRRANSADLTIKPLLQVAVAEAKKVNFDGAWRSFDAAMRLQPSSVLVSNTWKRVQGVLCSEGRLQARLVGPRESLYSKVQEHWDAISATDLELDPSARSQGFPQIIHQIWHQWPGGSSKPPVHLMRMIQSWRTLNPHWQHRLWDSAESRNLIAEKYPQFLQVYDSYPEHVQRVDALRYFILHRFGGVYVDVDIECLTPIASLLSSLEGKAQLLLPLEPKEHSHAWCTTAMIGMSFIASEPAHPFWEQVHTELALRAHYPVLLSTGPLMITDVVEKNVGHYWNATPTLLVMPPVITYPLHQYESSCSTIDPKLLEAKRSQQTIAVEHWCGSWRALELRKKTE